MKPYGFAILGKTEIIKKPNSLVFGTLERSRTLRVGMAPPGDGGDLFIIMGGLVVSDKAVRVVYRRVGRS